MAYGDEFQLDNVRPYDWAVFAARTGIARRLLFREMQRIGRAAPEAAALQAADDTYHGEEKGLASRIAAFVQEQSRKLIEMATPMLSVELD